MGFSIAMPQAALIQQLAGIGTSAVGAYYGARGKASGLQFKAQMAEMNAHLAETAAQTELLKGQQHSAALTLQAGHLKSRQRAVLAANGVDLGEGSAAEMLASTELMKEVDKQMAQVNAVRNAWGHRMQKANCQAQAVMARASAKEIRPAASAFSSLLGGAGRVARSWYSLKKSGAFEQEDDPIYTLGASRGWWGK